MVDVGRVLDAGLLVGREGYVGLPLLLACLDEVAQRRLSSAWSTSATLEVGKHYIACVFAARVHWRWGSAVSSEVAHLLLLVLQVRCVLKLVSNVSSREGVLLEVGQRGRRNMLVVLHAAWTSVRVRLVAIVRA